MQHGGLIDKFIQGGIPSIATDATISGANQIMQFSRLVNRDQQVIVLQDFQKVNNEAVRVEQNFNLG